MDDEVTVTVTMRGLADPATAALQVVNFMKRAMYQVNGRPGEFSAVIEAPAQNIRAEMRGAGEI